MGFRNPITSATAVDTGQPAGAGIRMYQGSDATGVFGVIESRDGIAGDTNAQIIDRANLVPQGGGYTQQGRTFTIKAGTANGVPAGPELDLNVEGLPAGGFGPVARLKNAGLVIDSPGTRVQGYVPLLGAAGIFTGNTDASGLVTITHSLGVIPTSMSLTPGDGPVRHLIKPVLITMTASQAQVLVIRTDTSAAIANNPVTVWWIAAYPAP